MWCSRVRGDARRGAGALQRLATRLALGACRRRGARLGCALQGQQLGLQAGLILGRCLFEHLPLPAFMRSVLAPNFQAFRRASSCVMRSSLVSLNLISWACSAACLSRACSRVFIAAIRASISVANSTMALWLRPWRSWALSAFTSSMRHCPKLGDGCHRGILELPRARPSPARTGLSVTHHHTRVMVCMCASRCHGRPTIRASNWACVSAGCCSGAPSLAKRSVPG